MEAFESEREERRGRDRHLPLKFVGVWGGNWIQSVGRFYESSLLFVKLQKVKSVME